MLHRRASVVSLLLAAVLGGCSHWPLDPAYGGPTRHPDELRPFRSVTEPTVLGRERLAATTDFVIERVTLASHANVLDPHDIVIDCYDVQADEPVPALLVLPILGGDNEIANIMARFMARRDLAVFIVHRVEGYKDVDELELMNATFQQIVLDHMQALDWIETRPEIDPTRIGLLGVSAGAINGSLVSALDQRITASVLALAGGDVPYLLSYSRDRGLRRKREAILAEHDISADELYDVMRAEFVHDPLRYAPRIDARDTLLVLARYDAVVPYHKGLELREAIGNPETIVVPTGHYGAIIFLPYIERAALRFFRSRFQRRR